MVQIFVQRIIDRVTEENRFVPEVDFDIHRPWLAGVLEVHSHRTFPSMTNQKAVADRLLQINAIRLNPENPFTWTSGWKSPIYCDNRKALGFPPVREFIKSEFC